MDVAQFLKELRVVADVEIIVAVLPEVFGGADQASRNSLFQRLDDDVEGLSARFAQQQMHMLGHDNVAIDAQSVASAHALECSFENIARFGRGEIFKPLMTAESDKVALPGLLDAPE